MKLKNCLGAAMQELRTCVGIFALFIVIAILLFSISSALLDMAMYLPDRIADEVKEMSADLIGMSEVQVEDANRLRNMPVELLDCTVHNYTLSYQTLGLSEERRDTNLVKNPLHVYGGVLLKSWEDSKLADSIRESLTEGECVVQSGVPDGVPPVWMSETVAQAFGLGVNDRLTLTGSEEELLATVFIQGIYGSADLKDYYISEAAYSVFLSSHANATLFLEVRPREFRDAHRILSWAKKNGFSPLYNEDVIVGTQMLYYTFYTINIILLLTLTGILHHLLHIYFTKRLQFYTVNMALGMRRADVIRILFCICEALALFVVLVSCGVSSLVLNNIGGYIQNLFTYKAADAFVLIRALLINFVLLQALMVAVLYRFYKKMGQTDIIGGIRCL